MDTSPEGNPLTTLIITVGQSATSLIGHLVFFKLEGLLAGHSFLISLIHTVLKYEPKF